MWSPRALLPLFFCDVSSFPRMEIWRWRSYGSLTEKNMVFPCFTFWTLKVSVSRRAFRGLETRSLGRDPNSPGTSHMHFLHFAWECAEGTGCPDFGQPWQLTALFKSSLSTGSPVYGQERDNVIENPAFGSSISMLSLAAFPWLSWGTVGNSGESRWAGVRVKERDRVSSSCEPLGSVIPHHRDRGSWWNRGCCRA